MGQLTVILCLDIYKLIVMTFFFEQYDWLSMQSDLVTFSYSRNRHFHWLIGSLSCDPLDEVSTDL